MAYCLVLEDADNWCITTNKVWTVGNVPKGGAFGEPPSINGQLSGREDGAVDAGDE